VASGVRLHAPAKVNLALEVGPRRPDGYHEVRTVLQALALGDEVTLLPAPDGELRLRCDPPEAGEGPANLGWRAAEALRRASGVRAGVRIAIRKRIPLQAGLGGGSSDAAAVLLGCSLLWRLDWTPVRLAEVAAGLGADVPFFLWGGTALAEGRGEHIRPLPPLPAWPVVVALSGPGISTADAYAALDALPGRPPVDVVALVEACRAAAAGRRSARAHLGALLANAFEAAVLPRRPDIALLRRRLQEAGAYGSLLCGSGAAVWALAPSAAWAHKLARELRAEGCWAAATRLHPVGVAVRAARGARALARGAGG
jgi:4-diphosphocytidyl-2-C-methyl-D-erythritol kinase